MLPLEKVSRLLAARSIPIGLRKRFVKSFIRSVVKYQSHTRIAEGKNVMYLESFDKDRQNKLSIDDVLKRIGYERSLTKTIKKKKKSWAGGDILRGKFLQRRFMGEIVEGRTGRRKLRIGRLCDIKRGKVVFIT